MSANGGAYVVLVTYNERDNVGPLLAGLRNAVPQAHVVVVDDNSPDGTGEVLDELRARDPRLHVVHRTGKLGYASAQIAGMQHALRRGAATVVTMDADLSHDPAYVPTMLKLLQDYDVVIGSRYVAGSSLEGQPRQRRVLSKVANAVCRVVLGLPAADCSAGFRAYRASLLQRVGLDSYTAQGYSFLAELLFRCCTHGARVGEVPIAYAARRYGASKLSGGIVLEGIGTVCRLFWERATGARRRG
ncbi:MAG: polyprenol monophosphomannose synthase [Armatimonadota bacterium]